MAINYSTLNKGIPTPLTGAKLDFYQGLEFLDANRLKKAISSGEFNASSMLEEVYVQSPWSQRMQSGWSILNESDSKNDFNKVLKELKSFGFEIDDLGIRNFLANQKLSEENANAFINSGLVNHEDLKNWKDKYTNKNILSFAFLHGDVGMVKALMDVGLRIDLDGGMSNTRADITPVFESLLNGTKKKMIPALEADLPRIMQTPVAGKCALDIVFSIENKQIGSYIHQLENFYLHGAPLNMVHPHSGKSIMDWFIDRHMDEPFIARHAEGRKFSPNYSHEKDRVDWLQHCIEHIHCMGISAAKKDHQSLVQRVLGHDNLVLSAIHSGRSEIFERLMPYADFTEEFKVHDKTVTLLDEFNKSSFSVFEEYQEKVQSLIASKTAHSLLDELLPGLAAPAPSQR